MPVPRSSDGRPPSVCPECGSDDLLWTFGRETNHGPLDGRLRMHDVTPIAYLACGFCSDVVFWISDDSTLHAVITGRG